MAAQTFMNEKEIPMFKGQLVVILTEEEAEEALSTLLPGFEPVNIHARTIYGPWLDGKEGFILVLNPWDDIPLSYGLITHECLHAANFIAQKRGLIADFDNDEAICYILEWVTDFVFSVLEEREVLSRLAHPQR